MSAPAPAAPAAPNPTPVPAAEPDADAETNNTLGARPRSSLSSFFFMSFLFFMITNSGGGDDSLLRLRYTTALQSLEWQYGNFTAWVNGTASPNFTMPALPEAETPLVHKLQPDGIVLDPEMQSYYPNVTGFIRGPSTVYNISPSALHSSLPAWAPDVASLMAGVNMTLALEKLGSWNWTAVERVAISVVEKTQELNETQKELVEGAEGIQPIQGHIELTDGNTDDEMRLDLAGVHFLNNGSIYAFATAGRSPIDIREIPSLVPDSARNATARAILPTLQARIEHIKEMLAAPDLLSLEGNNDQDSNDEPASKCGFHLYAQLAPTNVSSVEMDELEEELREPTGARTAKRSPLLVNAVLLSRECGVMMRVEKAEGLRSRLFFRKVTTYAGFSGLIYLGLLLLLSRQMARSRTPAALARISRWTFLAQIVADSIAFAGHITFAILADGRPSISLVAPAFLSCALFAYEVQFAMLIQQVQAPEDAAPARPSPPPAPTPAPPPPPPPAPVAEPASPWGGLADTQQSAPPSASAPQRPAEPRSPYEGLADEPTDTEPLLNNAEEGRQAPPAAPTPAPQRPTPTQPRFAALREFWSILRNDHQARTWLTISLLLFGVMRIILSPSLAMLVFVLLYSSIWSPQIYRAARRARTCGLSVEYMLGTTAGRVALGAYFLGCPRNVLDVGRRWWIGPLGVFMFAQVGFIVVQNTLGPAFFLPGSVADASASYDYHPPLPPPTDAESSSVPLGDCAICMDSITLDSNSDLDGKEQPDILQRVQLRGARGRGRRRSYALAPCHHLFHTECLERWLAIKNICPQCRRPLPPL